MANIGQVTQAFILAGTLEEGTAQVTQAYLIVAVGLGITCNNPPGGTVGVPYTHTFLSGGGDPPLTFAITAGSLPDGLALNTSTGVVSGAPTIARLFTFTIQVTDSFGAVDSVSCSILIVGSIIIQLLGWKLYPNVPCDDVLPAVEAPPVKRAV